MEKNKSNERLRLYIRFLLRIMITVASVLLLVFIVPSILSLFAPFLFALLLAFILNPLINLLHKKLHAPRRLFSAITVVLVFFGFATLIIWFVYFLLNDVVALSSNFQNIYDYVSSTYDLLLKNLKWFLDFLPGDTETLLSDIFNGIFSWMQSLIKNTADYIIANSFTITAKVSGGVVATIIFIMAAYFISADYPKINKMIEKYKGTKMHYNFNVVKKAAINAFGGYLKTQLLLSLMSFVIMFTALAFYKQPYALLIAIFLTIVDFLPLIGTIAILAPWSVLCFINGDIIKSIFLLTLGIAFFIFRKLMEPKVMSSQIGLHPLLALFGIYIGMKLMGILGMVLGPIILMVIISIKRAGLFDGTINDLKDVYWDIKNLLKRNE